MKAVILLVVTATLTTATTHRYRRNNRPSFLRDSVEKIINYPFKNEFMGTARYQDDRFRYNMGQKKSNLMDYLFMGFGAKKLPLREAVESLPVPFLSAEQRSFVGSGRLPLRDAVEHRTFPEPWNIVEEDARSKKYQNEDEVDVLQDVDVEAPRKSGGGFSYEISYDLFEQFDPMRYQLLPMGISGMPTSENQILGYRKPSNYSLRESGEVETFVDDDTVEILPERMEDFRSLARKGNRNRGKKPWEKNHIPDLGSRDPQDYKIICYLEGWANRRQEPMKFDNLDLDPYACTHIIYGYAAIDPHGFNIYPQDEEYDLVQGGYRSVVGLKRYNPDLKVLISIAGWADGDPKFTMMTSTAARRQRFIRSVAKFLDANQFDGIDLDWEYPGAEDLGGSRKDKENFASLLEELSEVFMVKNWILSAAVPPSRFRVEDGYDVMQISRYLDLINVLAFDLHSEREEVADHHSPLYRRDHDHGLDVFYNVDYAINYWIRKGAPRSKLVLGVPFFGRTFTLANASKWKPGSEIRGLGKEGKYTQEKGFLAYYEICEKLTKGSWRRNEDSAGSPFAVQGDQWVGYDDQSSVRNKVNYVKKQQLGGVVLYAVDLDDFQGICGEKWPLLSTVRNGLSNGKPIKQPVVSTTTVSSTFGSTSTAVPGDMVVPTVGTVIVRPGDANCTGQGYARDPYDCRVYHRCQWSSKTSYICPGNLHFDENLEMCNWPEQARCQQSSRPSPNKFSVMLKSAQEFEDDFKIVCYFTNWAWYRKGEGKFVPENMDPRLCTHIVYAYASLDPNDLKIKPFDMFADIDNNFYERVTSLPDPRNKNGKATVLLGLGGWTDSTGDKYSRLVSDMRSRREFILSTIAFLRRYRFQGLHIDWNYPKCWQSNCNKGPDSDMRNFAKLIKEMNYEFKKENPPLVLAAGISGYREVIDVGYDIADISKNIDFMSVMTYDYHGSWEKRTGHVSPLYYRTGDSFPRFNTNYTLEYLSLRGADRRKLLMGIPFYGQSYTLHDENDNTYGAEAEGPGVPGEFTKQPGMLAYYEICDYIRNKNWIVSRDPQGATGPYAFQSDQWVSYDDPDSVKEKARFIRNLGYGGAMAWTVDLDDFNNRCCRETFPLLRAIGRVLGHVSEDEPVRPDCTRPPPPVTPVPPVTTTGVDSGSGTDHTHTTWPTWTRPTTTSTTTSKPWWETTTTTSTTTRRPTTTTTTRRPTTWHPTTMPTTLRPTTTSWPMTTTSTSTSATSIETLTDEPTTPMKPCEPGKYYPDTLNCNAYYRCLLGEYKKQYCVGGLHWNPELNVCDWPESAKCDKLDFVNPGPPVTVPTSTTTTSTTTKKPNEWWTSTTTRRPGDYWTSTTTTTTTTTTRRPTTTGATLENCRSGEYYPVPGNCNMFFVCVNGRPITQSCAPGLYWNQQLQLCDWSHKVRCDSEANKYDHYTNIKDDNNPENKPCESGSFASYPGDCNRYLSCLWGVYAPFNCAPGLHWNQEGRMCDWPANAKCKAGSKPPGPVEGVEASGETDQGGDSAEIIPAATSSPVTTSSTTPGVIVPPPSTTQSGYFKIVCYFTNWAWYRQGDGKYLPENIDPDLCTHIVYGFAVLDYENLIIKAHDSWADFDNKFYERVVAYKKKGMKVTLAIGGWNDSQGDKYSRLVNSPSSRRKFITHVIQFLQKYNFDGLDLDWEYPKCWQVDCKKGPDSDKPAFAAFVKELHDAFKPIGLLLSSAVSPSKTVIDAGYDVPALGKYLDWVAVMTYDYHGQWDKKTGHVAPMFFHEEDDFYFFNANYSINYWISEGVPRRKIVMGMPLYGQSFQLSDSSKNGLNANAPGPGQAGEFTRAAGFLAYYEICERINNRGWTVIKDPKKRMGPYAYKGNQWVSFDDVDTIRLKSEYIRQMDLGGGMVWALDLDDFRNRCGGGRHPLLSTIRNVLGPSPDNNEISGTPYPPTFKPETSPEPEYTSSPTTSQIETLPWSPTTPSVAPELDLTSTPQVEVTTWTPSSRTEFKVVCYFTNWAWYRQGLGKYVPSDIDSNLCTHIIYGFAVLNGDQGIIKPHDTWADFDNKFYEKVTAFKSKGVKVLVAIGGWNDSAGDKYSRLVNNPSSRARFISHVIEFIEKNNFDGLDLDWEYPKCWQVNCKMGPDSDKPAFADFVRELKTAFRPKGLLLSAAVSPSKVVIDSGYDVPVLSQYLDWISVMTYDYHGQWDKITGHVAPMYLHPDDVDVTFHANFSINYWISQGADRKKIVMGMPMYGQSFSLANNQENGLNAKTYGGGEAGDFTRARGFLSYYEICHNIRDKGWKVVRDKKGRMGPYAYLRDQWVSFDDQAMIRQKSEYVRDMGLGGGMIWALDLDDFRDRCHCEQYPLLKTINRVLRNYPGPGPKCILDGDDERKETSTKKPTPTPKPTQKPFVTPKPQHTSQKPFVTSKPQYTTEKPARENLNCDGRIFADHIDCNKYYQCQHGVLHVMNCPSGLHWNKDHCDWPQNSNCQGTGANEVTIVESTSASYTTTSSSTWWSQQPESSTMSSTWWPQQPESSTMSSTWWPQQPEETTVHETERPKPETTTYQPPVIDSEYKVVCYFTNWAWYRQGLGKYTPENIDYELCTHIAYGFAVLDSNSLTIKPHDSWADLDNEFYVKVTNLKKRGIKVLIAIGGWNDSLGDKYSRLVNNPNSRRRFIENVMQFIEKYNFDGLDLDWEYPKCWQVNCNSGPDSDKENFAQFVEELSVAFKPKGWLLSSAVSPSKMVIDMGYDVPRLSRSFDYISVMTYDFHGHWDKATGHVAPLNYYPGDTYDYFNANFSINYWIEKGADRRKLIMGMPFYGQSFQLKDQNEHGLNAPAYGPGQAGEFTRAGGFLAFYEICDYVKRQGYTVVRDPEGRIGPYAYKGNQWVSYDDVSEIKRKSQFVKQMGLGGGMLWALDLDDFRNRCGCGTHPLLKTLNQELRGIGGRFSDCT